MKKQDNKGWFPMPKLRLGMAIIVLVFVVVSLNTAVYNKIINGTALINWMLMAIMFVCLGAMIVDDLTADAKMNRKSKNKVDSSKDQNQGGISQ